MPIYFNDIAPICPISRDEPVGPGTAPAIRTTVPIAFDLASAIAAANLIRGILQQILAGRTINNTFDINIPGRTVGGGQPKLPKTINKLKASRWSEDTSQRVFHPYKYYGEDDSGNRDPDTWILVQRIEQMVWYDRGWQTYLVWVYGDKGEGESQ